MREQSEVKHKITLNTLALSDRVLADVLLQLLRDRVHGGGRGRPPVRHRPPVVEQLLLHATDALVAHLGEEGERVGGQLRRVGARGGVVREEGLRADGDGDVGPAAAGPSTAAQ